MSWKLSALFRRLFRRRRKPRGKRPGLVIAPLEDRQPPGAMLFGVPYSSGLLSGNYSESLSLVGNGPAGTRNYLTAAAQYGADHDRTPAAFRLDHGFLGSATLLAGFGGFGPSDGLSQLIASGFPAGATDPQGSGTTAGTGGTTGGTAGGGGSTPAPAGDFGIDGLGVSFLDDSQFNGATAGTGGTAGTTGTGGTTPPPAGGQPGGPGVLGAEAFGRLQQGNLNFLNDPLAGPTSGRGPGAMLAAGRGQLSPFSRTGADWFSGAASQSPGAQYGPPPGAGPTNLSGGGAASLRTLTALPNGGLQLVGGAHAGGFAGVLNPQAGSAEPGAFANPLASAGGAGASLLNAPAVGVLSPLAQLNGGRAGEWLQYADGSSLPPAGSSASPTPVSIQRSGSDDLGSYTLAETGNSVYVLEETGGFSGTFALTETVQIDFDLNRAVAGGAWEYAGHSGLVAHVWGSYSGTGFTVSGWNVTEAGNETLAIDKSAMAGQPAVRVWDAAGTFALTGTGDTSFRLTDFQTHKWGSESYQAAETSTPGSGWTGTTTYTVAGRADYRSDAAVLVISSNPSGSGTSTGSYPLFPMPMPGTETATSGTNLVSFAFARAGTETFALQQAHASQAGDQSFVLSASGSQQFDARGSRLSVGDQFSLATLWADKAGRETFSLDQSAGPAPAGAGTTTLASTGPTLHRVSSGSDQFAFQALNREGQGSFSLASSSLAGTAAESFLHATALRAQGGFALSVSRMAKAGAEGYELDEQSPGAGYSFTWASGGSDTFSTDAVRVDGSGSFSLTGTPGTITVAGALAVGRAVVSRDGAESFTVSEAGAGVSGDNGEITQTFTRTAAGAGTYSRTQTDLDGEGTFSFASANPAQAAESFVSSGKAAHTLFRSTGAGTESFSLHQTYQKAGAVARALDQTSSGTDDYTREHLRVDTQRSRSDQTRQPADFALRMSAQAVAGYDAADPNPDPLYQIASGAQASFFGQALVDSAKLVKSGNERFSGTETRAGTETQSANGVTATSFSSLTVGSSGSDTFVRTAVLETGSGSLSVTSTVTPLTVTPLNVPPVPPPPPEFFGPTGLPREAYARPGDVAGIREVGAQRAGPAENLQVSYQGQGTATSLTQHETGMEGYSFSQEGTSTWAGTGRQGHSSFTASGAGDNHFTRDAYAGSAAGTFTFTASGTGLDGTRRVEGSLAVWRQTRQDAGTTQSTMAGSGSESRTGSTGVEGWNGTFQLGYSVAGTTNETFATDATTVRAAGGGLARGLRPADDWDVHGNVARGSFSQILSSSSAYQVNQSGTGDARGPGAGRSLRVESIFSSGDSVTTAFDQHSAGSEWSGSGTASGHDWNVSGDGTASFAVQQVGTMTAEDLQTKADQSRTTDGQGSEATSSESFTATTDSSLAFTASAGGPGGVMSVGNFQTQGVPVVSGLTFTTAGSESYTEHSTARDLWHWAEPAGSYSDGTVQLDDQATGSGNLSSTLTGYSLGQRLVVTGYARGREGQEHTQSTEVGRTFSHQTGAGSEALVSPDGYSDSTSSYSVADMGQTEFTERAQGADQAGGFGFTTFARAETGAEQYLIDEARSSDGWHGTDTFGSWNGGNDSYTAHTDGTGSFASNLFGRTENGQFVVTSYVLVESAREGYNKSDGSQVAWQTVGFGAYEEGARQTIDLSVGTATTSTRLTGHTEAGTFVVTDYQLDQTRTDDTSSHIEQANVLSRSVVGGLATVPFSQVATTALSADESFESYTSAELGSETSHVTARGHQAGDTFVIDSFTLAGGGQETFALDRVSRSDSARNTSSQEYERSSSLETLSSVGTADFARDQGGGDVGTTFQNAQFLHRRVGTESFTINSSGTDASRKLKDTQGSFESVTNSLTAEVHGTSAFTATKEGADAGSAFSYSLLQIDRTGASTFAKTETSAAEWLKVLDGTQSYAAGSWETGTEATTRVSTGSDTYSTSEKGASGAGGFAYNQSFQESAGTESYQFDDAGRTTSHTIVGPQSASTAVGRVTTDSTGSTTLSKAGRSRYHTRLDYSGSYAAGSTSHYVRTDAGDETYTSDETATGLGNKVLSNGTELASFTMAFHTAGSDTFTQDQTRHLDRAPRTGPGPLAPADVGDLINSGGTLAPNDSSQTLTANFSKAANGREATDQTLSSQTWRLGPDGQRVYSFDSSALVERSDSLNTVSATATDVNNFRADGTMVAARTGSESQTLDQYTWRRDDQPKSVLLPGSANTGVSRGPRPVPTVMPGDQGPTILPDDQAGGFSLTTETLGRHSFASFTSLETLTARPATVGGGTTGTTAILSASDPSYRPLAAAKTATGTESYSLDRAVHLEARQKRARNTFELMNRPYEDVASDSSLTRAGTAAFTQTDVGATDEAGRYADTAALHKVGFDSFSGSSHVTSATVGDAGGTWATVPNTDPLSFGAGTVQVSEQREVWENSHGSNGYVLDKASVAQGNMKWVSGLSATISGSDGSWERTHETTRKTASQGSVTGGTSSGSLPWTPSTNDSEFTFTHTVSGTSVIDLRGRDYWVPSSDGGGTYVFGIDRAAVDVTTTDASQLDQQGDSGSRSFDLTGNSNPATGPDGQLNRGLTTDATGSVQLTTSTGADYRIQAVAAQDLSQATWQLSSFAVDGTWGSRTVRTDRTNNAFVNRQSEWFGANQRVETGGDTTVLTRDTAETFTLGYGAARTGSGWQAQRYSLTQTGAESYAFEQTLRKDTDKDGYVTDFLAGAATGFAGLAGGDLAAKWVKATKKVVGTYEADGASSYSLSRSGIGDGSVIHNRRSGVDHYSLGAAQDPGVGEGVLPPDVPLESMPLGSWRTARVGGIAFAEEFDGHLANGTVVEDGKYTYFAGTDGENKRIKFYREPDTSAAPSEATITLSETRTNGYSQTTQRGDLVPQGQDEGTKSARTVTKDFIRLQETHDLPRPASQNEPDGFPGSSTSSSHRETATATVATNKFLSIPTSASTYSRDILRLDLGNIWDNAQAYLESGNGERTAVSTTVDATSSSGPGGSSWSLTTVVEQVAGVDQWRDTYQSGSGITQENGGQPVHQTLTFTEGKTILNKAGKVENEDYQDLVSFKLLEANWGEGGPGSLTGALPEPGRIPAKVEEAARNLLGAIAAAGTQLREGKELSAIADGVREAARKESDPLRAEVADQLTHIDTLEKRLDVVKKEIPDSFRPKLPPPPKSRRDAFATISDFFAVWADRVSFGLTQQFRQQMGYDDAVDYNSWGARVGGIVGDVHNLLMGFGGAAGGGLGLVQRGMNLMGASTGISNGIAAWRRGDYEEAFLSFSGALLVGTRGFSVCGLGRTAVWTNRAILGTAAAIQVSNGLKKIQDNNWVDGLLDIFNAAAGLYQASKACFVAGTPIRTPAGSKAIEEVRGYNESGDECDYVLSRSEFDPTGPVIARRVLRRFTRVSPVLNLHVGGRLIGTTAEHPFYVAGRGWVPCQELVAGDRIVLESGEWVRVDGVADSGRVATVYNLEVDADHTYFVGCPEWGFSVWAHNAYREFSNVLRKRGVDREVIRDAFGKLRAGEVEEARAILRDALDNGKRSPEAINRMIDRAVSQMDSLSRPSEWRPGFMEEIEGRMPTMPDGKPAVYDLVDGKVVLRERLPGEAVDIGHIPGMEHRKLVRQYSEMTQAEFNQLLHEHPEWFRIESDLLSKSHKGEIR